MTMLDKRPDSITLTFMKVVSKRVLNEFVAGCHRIAAKGLVRCSSGNVSWRVGKDRFLIKSSRAWLEDMSRDDIAVCRLSDNALLHGRKPSVEIGFHTGILRRRSDVNIVLHFQTPCATTLACLSRSHVNYFLIPEIPYYIGTIAEIPYSPPGSATLARTVTAAMAKHDLVQIRNHGQVTVGRDFRHVIQNAAFFELACEIVLQSRLRARPMPAREARRLRTAEGT